jgi:hypothetical protein
MRIRWQDGVAVAALSCAVCAAAQADSLREALSLTQPTFDARLRFEAVEQDAFVNQADAVTLRARAGFETGKAWASSLLVEGEAVWPLKSDYNSTTNGNVAYPVVADPESYEINRLQLTNGALPGTVVTLGRQRITLDDQRFVGAVGWRQNEQTFDSLRAINTSLANTTFDVAYVSQVNRIFGKESLQGRFAGDSVLANVSYQLPLGKLAVCGYWLDFENLAGVPAAVRDASETLGLRFTGEKPLPAFKIGYAAAYAVQSEHADNPLAFELDYLLLELSGAYKHFTVGVGLESLEGDGDKGFTTPLATLHKFQGWADKFLATPADGIEDRYVSAGLNFKALGVFDALGALVSYHSYKAERIAADYGAEINVQAAASIGRFTGSLKYANYEADALFTDTAKFWVQVEYAW